MFVGGFLTLKTKARSFCLSGNQWWWPATSRSMGLCGLLRVSWGGGLSQVTWHGCSRGAWKGCVGRVVCAAQSKRWNFLWQPGAALSSKRVSGMPEAGIGNIIKHNHSGAVQTFWGSCDSNQVADCVWRGSLRELELLPGSGVRNFHHLILNSSSGKQKIPHPRKVSQQCRMALSRLHSKSVCWCRLHGWVRDYVFLQRLTLLVDPVVFRTPKFCIVKRIGSGLQVSIQTPVLCVLDKRSFDSHTIVLT